MIKRIAISLSVVLVLLVSLVAPVFAIDDPDTAPSVRAVYVYENLLETGDCGVLIDYFLDYDPAPGIPDEVVTEAYFAIFIDTDGTTQLKAVSPYTYVDSGYGRGMAWIYFTADEVTLYSIDSADEADYRVWLTGNPTLTWAADPPKTIATIDQWSTVADPSTLLALRVLYFADVLELIWELDLVEATSLGNRLTAAGSDYFENVIANLRTMAPAAFSAGELDPVYDNVDYTTTFGAILDDGTGTAVGAPIDLVTGSNTVAVTVDGTFTLVLDKGTVGTATTGTVTIAGSPVDLVAGTNTITTTAGAPGNITVVVALEDTQTIITDTISGTVFDLSDAATAFGMSTMMFSGMVWLFISVIICGAIYSLNRRAPGYGGGGGKAVMIIFNLCIIGGAILGLIPVLVAVLMFLGFGAITGYVLFFRGANV